MCGGNMGEDNQEKKHHSGLPLLIVNTFHISCDFELLRTRDSLQLSQLGKPVPSKKDEFSEKFKTAIDPPPHFRKIMLRIFSKIHDRSTPYNGKNL